MNGRRTAALITVFVATANPAFSRAVDCVPGFYEHIPRDRDFYYAAGKGTDAAAAREEAAEALAATVALPVEGVAGFEQDDGKNCAGASYVLVRVEKARVEAYIRANRKWRDQEIGRLKSSIDSLKSEQRENDLRIAQATGRMQRIAELPPSGPIIIQVNKSGKVRQPPSPYIRSIYEEKLRPRLNASLAKIDTGIFTNTDIAMVIVSYNTMQDGDSLLNFCRKILGKKFNLSAHPGLRPWVIMQCAGGANP